MSVKGSFKAPPTLFNRKVKMNEIIAQLFLVRDIAHAIHLRTRSFAQHVALGDFYTAIVPLIDALAEAYAGRYGIVNVKIGNTPMLFSDSDARSFIQSVDHWASSIHGRINPEDTFIINQWDEILSLINGTKYKLDNLV